MNILVTLDRNYLPPLRVMLGSLLRNDPGETFEIYAIGDGLMPEDWAALEELCAGRGRIHPLEVPADLFADAPVARYWTRAMYYRLLAAELLPRSLDRVLYLDVPTELSEQMMRRREQLTHTTADIHERDEAYLRSCRESAAMVVDYGGWTRIDCARDGQVRSVDDIHREVMERLRDLLEGIK